MDLLFQLLFVGLIFWLLVAWAIAHYFSSRKKERRERELLQTLKGKDRKADK